MNRIVREHYPASKLPDDLRAGLDPAVRVRVEISTEIGGQVPARRLGPLVGSGRNVHGSEPEVHAHLNELRRDR